MKCLYIIRLHRMPVWSRKMTRYREEPTYILSTFLRSTISKKCRASSLCIGCTAYIYIPAIHPKGKARVAWLRRQGREAAAAAVAERTRERNICTEQRWGWQKKEINRDKRAQKGQRESLREIKGDCTEGVRERKLPPEGRLCVCVYIYIYIYI